MIMLTVTSVITGCKLAVIVPPGGMVQSSSTTRDCDSGTGGNFCTFDITTATLPFNESFSAIAKPGYQFVRWQDGNGFQCANSTSPTCTLTINDDAYGAAILSSYQMGKFMPVFKDVGLDTDGDGALDRTDPDDDNDGILDADDNCQLDGPNMDGFGCPGPDTVTVNGRTWYQPDLFQGITRDEIVGVCPLFGPCV